MAKAETLSSWLSFFFKRYTGQDIKIRSYRHIALLIYEKWALVYKPKTETTAVFNIQGGHGMGTTSASYALTQEDMRNAPRHAIPVFLEASSLWHQVIGQAPAEKLSLVHPNTVALASAPTAQAASTRSAAVQSLQVFESEQSMDFY
jgi:hypothetical protein